MSDNVPSSAWLPDDGPMQEVGQKRNWPRDIRFVNMLADIERNGPTAIEKYPAALRIALEFGDVLRMLAHLVRVGDIHAVANLYNTTEAQLINRIETYSHTDIVRAADEARRDERRHREQQPKERP